MLLIGFTSKTSRIIPKVFCHKFRHCAPVVSVHGRGGNMIMFQFVRRRHITRIALRQRDLDILRAHGWVFVCVGKQINFNPDAATSCVDLARRAAGYNRQPLQTPDALYRQITKNRQ